MIFRRLFPNFGAEKIKTPSPDYDRTMDDFCTTWMGALYELCVSEHIDDKLHFDDATETLYEGFQMRDDLTVGRIAQYSETDVENLVIAATQILEHDRLKEEHIRYLLEEALWNWGHRPERPVYSDYVSPKPTDSA